MSAQHTPGPWGIEQTRDTLWVGPLRQDGHKVDFVVVSLPIDSNLTASAALRQHTNARLIAAAPELFDALELMINVSRSSPGFSAMARKGAEAAIAKARGDAA